MMNHDDHQRRIEALLRKAESTNSPEEALACTEAAQRLMLKYSIDQAMIDAKAGRDDDPIMTQEFTLHHTSAHAWRIITFLVSPTIQAMGTCRMVLLKGNRKSYWIIGRRDDIDTTAQMVNSLIAQGMNQMKHWATIDPIFMSLDRNAARAAKGQFLMSFGQTVTIRLQALFREEVSHTAGSELVLANRVNRVDAFMAENLRVTEGRPTNVQGSHYGREEGRQAGMRANLGNALTR